MTQIVPISGMKPLFEQNAQGAVRQETTMPFSNILQESLQNLQQAQEVAAQDSYNLAMGNADDLHSIMIHSAQATAALEMTVQVASRAMNAYKEILQMQI